MTEIHRPTPKITQPLPLHSKTTTTRKPQTQTHNQSTSPHPNLTQTQPQLQIYLSPQIAVQMSMVREEERQREQKTSVHANGNGNLLGFRDRETVEECVGRILGSLYTRIQKHKSDQQWRAALMAKIAADKQHLTSGYKITHKNTNKTTKYPSKNPTPTPQNPPNTTPSVDPQPKTSIPPLAPKPSNSTNQPHPDKQTWQQMKRLSSMCAGLEQYNARHRSHNHSVINTVNIHTYNHTNINSKTPIHSTTTQIADKELQYQQSSNDKLNCYQLQQLLEQKERNYQALHHIGQYLAIKESVLGNCGNVDGGLDEGCGGGLQLAGESRCDGKQVEVGNFDGQNQGKCVKGNKKRKKAQFLKHIDKDSNKPSPTTKKISKTELQTLTKILQNKLQQPTQTRSPIPSSLPKPIETATNSTDTGTTPNPNPCTANPNPNPNSSLSNRTANLNMNQRNHHYSSFSNFNRKAKKIDFCGYGVEGLGCKQYAYQIGGICRYIKKKENKMNTYFRQIGQKYGNTDKINYPDLVKTDRPDRLPLHTHTRSNLQPHPKNSPQKSPLNSTLQKTTLQKTNLHSTIGQSMSMPTSPRKIDNEKQLQPTIENSNEIPSKFLKTLNYFYQNEKHEKKVRERQFCLLRIRDGSFSCRNMGSGFKIGRDGEQQLKLNSKIQSRREGIYPSENTQYEPRQCPLLQLFKNKQITPSPSPCQSSLTLPPKQPTITRKDLRICQKISHIESQRIQLKQRNRICPTHTLRQKQNQNYNQNDILRGGNRTARGTDYGFQAICNRSGRDPQDFNADWGKNSFQFEFKVRQQAGYRRIAQYL